MASEPKEHLFVPYSELQEGDELTDAFTIAKSYYLKSEADKVIADKGAEIADLIEKNKRLANKDMIMASETIKGVFNELNQQKFKRCLDKAKWCKAEADAAFLRYNWDSGRYAAVDFYEKWHKRWLELSEKFKEDGND